MAVIRLHGLEEVLDFFFFQRELVEVVDHVHVLQGRHGKRDEAEREDVRFLLVYFIVVEDCLAAQLLQEFWSEEAFRFQVCQVLAVPAHAGSQELDVSDSEILVVVDENRSGLDVSMCHALRSQVV